MLAIHTRLSLIAWKLDIEKRGFVKEVVKYAEKHRHIGRGFSKEYKLRAYFKDKRTINGEEKPGAGARLTCDDRDTELIYLVCKDIAERNGKTITDNIRLDSEISDFLNEIAPTYSVVKRFLGKDAQHVLNLLEEYALPKDRFLPEIAVIRNSQIPKKFPKLFKNFAVFRAKAYTEDDRQICKEFFQIDDTKFPLLKYHDTYDRTYKGYTFFSNDKLVSASHCVGLDPHYLQSALITVFAAKVGPDELLAVMQRFDSHEGKAHVYRAVCLPVEKITEPVKSIGFLCEEYIRYYDLLSNANPEVGGATDASTFQCSISSAKEAIRRGNKLVEQYRLDIDKYKNIDSSHRLISQLKTDIT